MAEETDRPPPDPVRRLFELSLDMLGTASTGGRFTELNPAWERTLGWTRAELMAQPYLSFVHRDDLAATQEQAERLAQPGSPSIAVFENRYRTRDGGFRRLRWSAVVDGGIVYFVVKDVTGSLAADDVRRREAQSLAGLGTWELELATGRMQWSEEYRELYGIDPDRFIASRAAFEEIVHPEDRGLVADTLEQIIRDGTTVEVRYRITRPSDGAERCIRSHFSAQTDSAGDPIRVFGTGQDVTDLVMVLSPREREMLVLLADGLAVEEISERYVLSPATVRTHIQNAMVKLGAHTRGQAIATALRSGQIGS